MTPGLLWCSQLRIDRESSFCPTEDDEKTNHCKWWINRKKKNHWSPSAWNNTEASISRLWRTPLHDIIFQWNRSPILFPLHCCYIDETIWFSIEIFQLTIRSSRSSSEQLLAEQHFFINRTNEKESCTCHRIIDRIAWWFVRCWIHERQRERETELKIILLLMISTEHWCQRWRRSAFIVGVEEKSLRSTRLFRHHGKEEQKTEGFFLSKGQRGEERRGTTKKRLR